MLPQEQMPLIYFHYKSAIIGREFLSFCIKIHLN